MDENNFGEAYVWWKKLNPQGKQFSKNIDAIEESLVKEAKEDYSNRDYILVATALESHKFTSTRYAKQARDLAAKARKWLEIRNTEMTTLKRLGVNFVNYNPGTIVRVNARPKIIKPYSNAPFFGVCWLEVPGSSFMNAGFFSNSENSPARRERTPKSGSIWM
jgi:hypothetical protein